MFKHIFPFFILLFFIFIIGGAIHYHDDGLFHIDCPLCVLSLNNLAFITQDNNDIALTDGSFFYLFIEDTAIVPSIVQKILSIRAPPA
jgi:hypothetical protein